MCYKTISSGLLSLCLLTLLPGCAAPSPQVRVEKVLPPKALLEDCPRPEANDVTTNGDLLRLIAQWEQALGLCNIDKRALREWASKEYQ